MITCLGFVFFDRRRSKERGQYFGKFLGKIDEIQKWTILTKPTWAHLKAFLMSFSLKQSNSSWVYFFLNFTSTFTAYLGFSIFSLFWFTHPSHTPYFFHRKKSNFIFSYRAWKTLENEPMTSCLGFVFFGVASIRRMD